MNFAMIIRWNAFSNDNYRVTFSRNKVRLFNIDFTNNMIYIRISKDYFYLQITLIQQF